MALNKESSKIGWWKDTFWMCLDWSVVRLKIQLINALFSEAEWIKEADSILSNMLPTKEALDKYFGWIYDVAYEDSLERARRNKE